MPILSKRFIFNKPNYFVGTWKTDNTSSGSSNDNQIKLPLESSGTYNFTVDWGDGNKDIITAYNQAEVTHTYSNTGTYTLKIKGVLIGFCFNNTGDKLKILSISKCNILELGNSGSNFYGCTNLSSIGTKFKGKPTSLAAAFRACATLNSIIDIDCSEATNTASMLYGCIIFNKPLNLDTIKSTSMQAMFYQCNVFNNALSLNTSNVTNMANMFDGCFAFNQAVSFMDTAKVTTMSAMFGYCYAFNNSVSSFDTANVTNMANMFDHCTAFNQSVSSFDTAKVTTMANMFTSCANFNQDISGWDIGLAANMTNMLTNAVSWSTENYDKFLIGAHAQALTTGVQDGVSFRCSSNYTLGGAAETAKTYLQATKAWTIQDNGGV